MSDLLASTPGRVAVISTGASLPGSISVTRSGLLGSSIGGAQVFQSSRVIITGAQYAQAGNIQFQQSLRDTIYMYTFGERMGQLELSGLAFSSSCADSGNTQSGVDDILGYYQSFRASKAGDSITVIVGRTPIVGYLVSCSVRVANPANMLYAFSFSIAALPPGLDSSPNSDALPASSQAAEPGVLTRAAPAVPPATTTQAAPGQSFVPPDRL